MTPHLDIDALAILNQSPALTYVSTIGDAPRLAFVSDAVRKLLGYEPEAFERPGFFTEMVHEDDRPSLAHSISVALRFGTAVQDRRVRTASGEWRWFRDTFRVVRDVSGAPIYGVGTIFDVTDEKHATAALEKRTAEYRVLADHSSDLITRVTMDGKFLYQSPSATAVMGFEPEGRRGLSVLDQIHADDHHVLEAAWRVSLKTRAPQFLRYRAFRADGRWITLEAALNPVVDPATNKVVEFVVVSRDVTERLQTEERIARQQAHMREQGEIYDLFTRYASDFFLRIALDGRMTHISQSHERVLGPDTLLRDGRMAESCHPDDLEATRAAWSEAIATGKATHFRNRVLHAEGRWVWIDTLLTPVTDEAGAVAEMIAVCRDADAQVLSAQALAAANARIEEQNTLFKLLSELGSDIFLRFGATGQLLYASPSRERILGEHPAADGGMVSHRVHPDDLATVESSFMRALATRLSVSYRHRYRHADGHWVWLEVALTPLVDDTTGQVAEFIGVARDVSAHMAHERAIGEANAALETAKAAADSANIAKSRFLATMSHELRTPMTGIMGMLELIADGPLTGEQKHFLGLARESAENLLGIVNDVLDFSKIEAGQIEIERAPFALAAAAERVIALLTPMAAKRGNSLTMAIAPGTPDRLVGDQARLRQVLFNLAGNAVKFTQEGLVTLSIAPAANGGLRVEVRDTGPGIARDTQARLFHAFVQGDGSDSRKAGGTGLGLAISKSLVEAMGGHIGCESELGHGSTFWFELPAELPVAHDSSTADARAASQDERRRFDILVAEDHPVNQQLLAALLKRDGHRATIVGDGRKALDAVQRRSFDVILMDIQMPVMDGPTATRAIRALESQAASVPIVAVTANALRGDMEAYLDAGMNAYISKPIRIEILRETLEAVVPRHERRLAS